MKQKIICILCAVFALCSCTTIVSKIPIGETPAVLNEKEWDGIWFNFGGEHCVMKVKEGDKGVLQLGWIENDKEMRYKSSDVFIRKSGNWLFANMKDEDEKNGFYLWAIIKKHPKMIFIWLPDQEQFKKLIEIKTIPGEIKKGEVILGDLNPEHMQTIISEKRRFLFDWENPLVLVRMSD